MFGQRDRVARPGAGFDLGPRLLQRSFALLAAGDLFGNAQPVLQGRAVGLLGLLGPETFDRLLGLRAGPDIGRGTFLAV